MLTTKNETHPKRQVSNKFFLLFFVLISYFFYLNIQFDVITSGVTSLITWSFFVLCTPIADAGFLLDFPLRLIFGIRMLVSELVVWILAIAINIITLIYFPDYYQATKLTSLMYAIITTPYPYWAVILLSGIGTFLSIRFADELMDVAHHKDRHYFFRHSYKHELIIITFFVLVLVGYYKLIASLGIDVS